MEITYKGSKVYYKIIGNGTQNIVYLHGWGTNGKFFEFMANDINAKNILIDFPPFGKSQEPKVAYDLGDYANIVKSVLKQEGIKEFCIISHSFGTRVAIYLITIYNVKVNKLIITGGAGLKTKNVIKKIFRQIKYKILKFINKNYKAGSKDYRDLSKVMKQTFNNVIARTFDKDIKKIKCPTLLVFGNKDTETPMYMAKKFNKNIPNSKLIIYKNFDHFAYIKNGEQFLLDTKIFLRG